MMPLLREFFTVCGVLAAACMLLGGLLGCGLTAMAFFPLLLLGPPGSAHTAWLLFAASAASGAIGCVILAGGSKVKARATITPLGQPVWPVSTPVKPRPVDRSLN